MTISGMSKTYAVTGWRVGTIIAPPELTHAFRQVHDFVSIGAAAPLARGRRRRVPAAPAVLHPARRRLPVATGPVLQGLWEIGFEFEAPQGAYYIMAGIAAFGVTDDVDFARYLVRDIGVATVPGSSFFQDKALGRPTCASASANVTKRSTRRRSGCGSCASSSERSGCSRGT